ncbi:MAG: methyltransferase domain-containing protein [bacterium]|nr:methyltransferase domain-containing protein [bacterium]
MQNKDEKKMKLKYRILSKFYDSFYSLLEGIVFYKKEKNPRKALAAKIPDTNLRILDVCTGTGKDSIAIAKANNTIIGIDLSADMIAVANKKVKKRGIRNINFRQMDAANMDWQNEEFDITMTSFGLHEMEYELMISVLTDIFRVLKKDGKLFIIDYGTERGPFLRILFAIYLRISYPRRVRDFLSYDWDDILSSIGFRFDADETYPISRLICATK